MATGQLHRNQDKRRVLQLAHQVSATIGLDFFRAMSKHLAEALEADYVLVAEFVGGQAERVKLLAGFPGTRSGLFDYPLAGSAASKIALGKAVMCRSVAQHKFPSDEALSALQAQAFVGIPLATPEGSPSGALIAVYRKPISRLSLAKSVLEVFAPRAAAELARKQESERLRESEQRYQAFVMLNADAMWRIEFEQYIATDLPEQEQLEQIYQFGYVAECNDALARQFGFERASQLTGMHVSELAPMTTGSVREANLAAIRNGYRYTTVETTPVDRAGNRRHMLRSQWGIVEDGMLQRIWGTTRDITELKAVERELDTSEKQMSDLLETLRLVVVMLEEDGKIIYCNKHLYELTGWSHDEVIGKNWFELMIPPEDRDKAKAAFQSARQPSAKPTHYESTLLGPGGRRWAVAWDSASVRDAEGKIVIAANIGRDISEYKLLEAQVRQAQELESLGRLAGGIAHDFNNLLTVITGYNSVLIEKTPTTEPAYAGLIEIRRAAEKGADLTQRLLAFSRRQPPRPEAVDLSALISHDEPLLLRLVGDNVRLVTNLEPSLDLVHADAGQLRQVLFNLIVNARDAMPQGGKLTVSTSNRRASEGHFVELSVSDTGLGMTDEARRHLFEPFRASKESGAGTRLGLATVHGIVRQNGGQIEVDSAPGDGATFRIQFPALPAAEPQP
jgi:PAS domain S-box-containing protein